MGPISKNSVPNPKSFWFWKGVTLGPPQTSNPRRILGTCLSIQMALSSVQRSPSSRLPFQVIKGPLKHSKGPLKHAEGSRKHSEGP